MSRASWGAKTGLEGRLPSLWICCSCPALAISSKMPCVNGSGWGVGGEDYFGRERGNREGG